LKKNGSPLHSPHLARLCGPVLKGINETHTSFDSYQPCCHAGAGHCGQLARRESFSDGQWPEPDRLARLCRCHGFRWCFYFFAHQQAHGQMDHGRAGHHTAAKR